MTRAFCVYLGAALAVSLSPAASLTRTNLRGEYVEARNAEVYTGPCFANGEAGQVGNLAVVGWTVTQGAWEGVPLDGLSVVGVVHASNTLGAGVPVYPVKSLLILDERATVAQRQALIGFAQRMGGALLQNVVRVDYAPISLRVKDGNPHTGIAALTAGSLARIETRPLRSSDDICHNEVTFYPPLTPLEHAMPAYTLADRFDGAGLGTTWSTPGKRSAFVGTFRYSD
jgi:hypothetical protein